MRSLFILIITWCCLLTQLSAQSQDFQYAFKMEFYGYSSKEVRSYDIYNKKFSVSLLPSVYLQITKDILKSTSLTLKPGILVIPDSYLGLELGLLMNHNIFSDKLFLIGGTNMHYIAKSEDSNGAYKTNSHFIFFVVIGAGYELSKKYGIDISFHQSLNGEYGYTTGKFDSDARGPSKLLFMIKLGIKLNLFK